MAAGGWPLLPRFPSLHLPRLLALPTPNPFKQRVVKSVVIMSNCVTQLGVILIGINRVLSKSTTFNALKTSIH